MYHVSVHLLLTLVGGGMVLPENIEESRMDSVTYFQTVEILIDKIGPLLRVYWLVENESTPQIIFDNEQLESKFEMI